MSDNTPQPTSVTPTKKKRTKKPKTLLHSSGRPMRMILESEILAAQSISRTEAEVARRLGVTPVTYRKYADLYGIYGRVKNRAGKGINKPVKNENGGKYPLDHILNGQYPDYPIARLLHRIIRSNTMEGRCCRCTFSEKRDVDGKQPIILSFKDGNRKNKRKENLEILCYNCYFLTVNNPHGRPVTFSIPGQQETT